MISDRTKPSLVVTSDRLGHEAVANRLFPKVRSWFALGAPLELLSALSVARILVIIAGATWVFGAGLGALDRFTSNILLGLSIAGIAALVPMRALMAQGCMVVAVGHSAMITAALFTSDDPRRVSVLAMLLAAMAIFIGLFFVSYELIAMVALMFGVLVASSRFTNEGRNGVW